MWSHLLKKSLLENFIFCAVFREMGETSIHTTPPAFSHSSVIIYWQVFHQILSLKIK